MELTKTSGSETFKSNVNGNDVTASFQYDADGKVTQVWDGVVRKENRTLANFNIFYQPNGEFSKSYNFYSLNIDKEQELTGIINEFVSKAISKVNL
ncbi:MAG: hypothetical protein IKM12_00215 [Alistipes sp.]|nr:hypothetical protein [Alistipes sp.]